MLKGFDWRDFCEAMRSREPSDRVGTTTSPWDCPVSRWLSEINGGPPGVRARTTPGKSYISAAKEGLTIGHGAKLRELIRRLDSQGTRRVTAGEVALIAGEVDASHSP